MVNKKFSARARRTTETVIDNSATKRIKVDIDNAPGYDGYDQSNALVLPSKKRGTKTVLVEKPVTRILSKKQRKKLEQVVQRKQKKETRADLLKALASVQLSPEELQRYTSISAAQTTGNKKLVPFDPSQPLDPVTSGTNGAHGGKRTRVSSVAGSKKRRRIELLAGYAGDSDEDDSDGQKKQKDTNVVGLDESSSDDDDEASDEPMECTTPAPIPSIPTPPPSPPPKTLPKQKESVINTLKVAAPLPAPTRATVYVHVERDPVTQAARLKLPILAEEQTVMECINDNQIIIIAGETGSGKTTQVPQFLYEAGYAQQKMIAVTEPRRVAAISMSKRVAFEMGLSNQIVSYLIRFEGNTTEKTKIKFMTDGVLLKEIESDFTLSKYSVIILDEAHERSVYTDILIGLLSRIVPLRNRHGNPLKLIVMSATLRISDFTENQSLFRQPPPVIKVEARQFPVTVHFNKKTTSNYLQEAYTKTVKIHQKLPEGGILVFLTGQREVHSLVKKLRALFPFSGGKDTRKTAKLSSSADAMPVPQPDEDEIDLKRAIKSARKAKKRLASQLSLPQVNLDSYTLPGDDTEADLLDVDDDDDHDGLSDHDDDLALDSAVLKSTANAQPLWVLPLYSLLPSDKQALVFEPPPDGTRLCVVATNVAETSLTIPNIKYVVDSGRQKTRLYDPVTGVSAFVVTYESKAAANQRTGRAGRTAAGHCYRLFSSAVYEHEFIDFAPPEIQKKPVDDLMLQMKCMGIDKVVNFPFPSAPDRLQLNMAEKRLKMLGALEDQKVLGKADKIVECTTRVTALGRAIAAFPVAPRFGKMLALSHQHDLLPYTICMVAALSVQQVLQEVNLEADTASTKSKWHQRRVAWAGTGHSLLLGDPMVLLRAVGAAEYTAASSGSLQEFCETNGLRAKAMSEIRKLRVQLTNEINLSVAGVSLCVDPNMEPPSQMQAKYLRQVMLAGMGDRVAHLVPSNEIPDAKEKARLKYAYQSPDMETMFFMHAASVLRKTRPEWVVYQEVYEITNDGESRMFMRGVTAIEPAWLLTYARSMCNVTAGMEPPPKYDEDTGKVMCHAKVTFGRCGWELPVSETEMPVSGDACRHFAMFFLQGIVCPKLAPFKNQLLFAPSTMLKMYATTIPRINSLTKALARHQVCTRKSLFTTWQKNPHYLLDEYKDWLPESAASTIAALWPPIDKTKK